MINEADVMGVTTAEAVRLVEVVMSDDPRVLKDLGIMTVYKNPRTNVLSVSEIAEAYQNSRSSSQTFFPPAASMGYLVVLSIPENCYDEVLASLKKEIMITKINGVKTESGEAVEYEISDILGHSELEEEVLCTIM